MRATRFLVRLLPVIIILSATITPPALAQTSAAQPTAAKTKIILDTDIGDDIDDAFALALALRSPEVELLGITTAWGDTALRARLAQRFLQENHAPAIPVAVCPPTQSNSALSQTPSALHAPEVLLTPAALRLLI